jgi:phytoene dehydrogenase-like protein
VISTLSTTAEKLGVLGLPVPLRQLTRKTWDAVIVGAGHNGLTCAAYLARAGKSVLVLEAHERVGGACTLEEPFPGTRMSPCAYLAGLLHPLVVRELELVERGFDWTPALAGLFVPFEDGASVQLYEDNSQCDEEIRRLSPGDVKGWRELTGLIRRVRDAIRPDNAHDLWLGDPPTRDEIEDRVGHDEEAIGLLFEWSMVEMMERYIKDERLQIAYLGQGVIGTNASPFDKGTAYIRFHHACGRQGGLPGTWGYVKGGMGMISFLLCDAAQEAGAAVATGVRVARILPQEGVELESGELIRARAVISNADPRVTLNLLGSAADPAWRAQVASIPLEGCTVKLNILMRELPNFLARPGTLETHHHGQINTPLSKAEWKQSYAASQQGRIAKRLWTELYFQSVHDDTVVPPGMHSMSVFSQFVPYKFDEGDWDSHREDVKNSVLGSIGRFCSNLPDAAVEVQTFGPPDIEEKVGLTGGHIFQGSCLPQYMWSNRLRPRTPMPGVYLCGACTHPGGSVIAVNGRNAAMAVLKDC